MEGVQNLRRAVYDFKLRAEAADVGSKKANKVFAQALNYLYRCVASSVPSPRHRLRLSAGMVLSSSSPTISSRRPRNSTRTMTRSRPYRRSRSGSWTDARSRIFCRNGRWNERRWPCFHPFSRTCPAGRTRTAGVQAWRSRPFIFTRVHRSAKQIILNPVLHLHI